MRRFRCCFTAATRGSNCRVPLRLWRWLGAQRFAPSYWAYTFGVAATTVGTLKLALTGAEPARLLALPIFIAANLFIGYLTLRTAHLLWRRELI